MSTKRGEAGKDERSCLANPRASTFKGTRCLEQTALNRNAPVKVIDASALRLGILKHFTVTGKEALAHSFETSAPSILEHRRCEAIH
jgi:hypothetical protein